MNGRIPLTAALAAVAATVLSLALAGGASGAQEPPPNMCYGCSPPTQCEDGYDNDGDGKIDYPADPGCTDYGDPDEADQVPPPPPPPPPGACSDGYDNDGNGLADLDDFQGCTSSSDTCECGDNYPSSVSVDVFQNFYYQPQGSYVDSTGTRISCAAAGARRYAKDRILGKTVWSFAAATRWCWNGYRVTSVEGPQIMADTWGFPYNIPFPVSYRQLDSRSGVAGGSSAQTFAQGEFTVCGRKTSVCQTWRPWIRTTVYADGNASCGTDGGPVANCKVNG